MDTVVPKNEPALEGSISSMSTPEAEVETLTQDVAQTQKRKGGRKPVRKIHFPSYLSFPWGPAFISVFLCRYWCRRSVQFLIYGS